MAYIASIMFAIGSCCKSADKMRVFMLVGGVIFIMLFSVSDLSNPTNLANLLLNCFNVIMHIFNLMKKLIDQKLIKH